VAEFGMLIVLEIAPEMKAGAAAIMWMWLSTDRKRLPFLPQGLAQSKTADARPSGKARLPASSSRRHGRWPRRSPSSRSPGDEHVEGRVVQLFGRDAEGLVQNSSPSVHWLKTKRMSKADGQRASTFSISAGPKPWPMSEVWLMPGAWPSVP
jgi:hypothetical protein